MTNRKRAVLVVGLVAALALVAVVVQARWSSHASHAAVVYYCPMHPTYTSNRPGSCPICNMTLVQREDQASAAPGSAPQPQSAKDICIMHTCPMMKPGQTCPMLVVAKAGERVVCPVCGTHVAEAAGSPSAAPASGEKQILYWTDPMLPGYKADQPGKSPMGMDLVPVYAEERPTTSAPSPEGYAAILITPEKQQLIGVKTALVEQRRLTKTIRVAGTVAHDPELYQAQAEYIQALAALTQAQQQSASAEVTQQASALVDSTRIRLKHLGISDALIDEMATWQEPEHGLLFAHPGDPVWMYAQVYEYELPLVRVGQPVTVDVTALPGESFHGTVRAIDAMVDPMTRTTRVRAQLEDAEGHLRPDMYVNASIAVDIGDVVAVPAEAVFDTGAKRIIFVDKGRGLFEPRDVVVGAVANGAYEIKTGVAVGERVVTSGNFLIDSESRLKAALEGMSGSGGHQHGQ